MSETDHVRAALEREWACHLRDAEAAVAEAERAQVAALTEAHDAGLSLRDIAAITGISFNTVHRWIGNRGRRRRIIRAPGDKGTTT